MSGSQMTSLRSAILIVGGRKPVAGIHHLLDLSLDVLIDPGADPIDEEAFPEVWTHGDLVMPLTY